MIKRFLKKYREIISYLFFGVLTTAVGMGTYFIILYASRLFGINEGEGGYNAVRVVAQITQWVLAVLFAYYTNKKFVFLVKGGDDKTGKEAKWASRRRLSPPHERARRVRKTSILCLRSSSITERLARGNISTAKLSSARAIELCR